jgi:hypothetical protein
MKKIFYLSLLISLLLLIQPCSIFADGGMIIWPPDVQLDESAQNAIVAWNGKEEIIILSNDIESNAKATSLRIVPLPSNPTVKEGNFETFSKLTEIMNKKIEEARNQWITEGKNLGGAPTAGIEITFQQKIGAHDLTIVKVNDLETFISWIKNFANQKGLTVKDISLEFQEGVKNYLKRDIKFFVFDVIEASGQQESINPLVYRFNSDYFYFPILISGVSEISGNQTKIQLFIVTENKIPEENSGEGKGDFYWQGYFSYPVQLTKGELKEVNEEVAGLFESDVIVRTFNYNSYLKDFDKDLVFFPQIWQRYLRRGDSGEDVKALQKFLINEGYWNSEVEATGYFGPITKNALIKFQEYFEGDILNPLGLKTGTGYFGPKTEGFVSKSLSLLPSLIVKTCVDKCGDEVCQEVVCMAIGCPCAETKDNCPRDCK